MRSVQRAPIPAAAFALLSSIALVGGCAGEAIRAQEAEPAVAALPARESDYDLASLEIFRRVDVQTNANYVERRRIRPKGMFVSALKGVENQVAEVMVEVTGCEGEQAGAAAEAEGKARINANAPPGCGKAKVTVGSYSREFDF